MTILLILLATILFWLVILAPFFIRLYARTRADQIFYTHRPATEKLINRCIRILTWTNHWITAREELDRIKIDRLRDMLDEMQKPHD
jgi:membrane protein required for beta-lactamase induction